MQRRRIAKAPQQPALMGRKPRRSGESKAERSEPRLAFDTRLGYVPEGAAVERVLSHLITLKFVSH